MSAEKNTAPSAERPEEWDVEIQWQEQRVKVTRRQGLLMPQTLELPMPLWKGVMAAILSREAAASGAHQGSGGRVAPVRGPLRDQ